MPKKKHLYRSGNGGYWVDGNNGAGEGGRHQTLQEVRGKLNHGRQRPHGG